MSWFKIFKRIQNLEDEIYITKKLNYAKHRYEYKDGLKNKVENLEYKVNKLEALLNETIDYTYSKESTYAKKG
jgi:hypothetical protein